MNQRVGEPNSARQEVTFKMKNRQALFHSEAEQRDHMDADTMRHAPTYSKHELYKQCKCPHWGFPDQACIASFRARKEINPAPIISVAVSRYGTNCACLLIWSVEEQAHMRKIPGQEQRSCTRPTRPHHICIISSAPVNPIVFGSSSTLMDESSLDLKSRVNITYTRSR
jgi:hypothetical protein